MLFNRKLYTDLTILLCLTLLLAQTASAQFTGRTWSAFPDGAKAVCADDDIDNDDDRLIEICDLEGLNAIRNNRSGSGNQEQGCPSSGCNGYELVRDLDFNDNGSYSNAANNKNGWTTGSGWNPIGGYNARFEGNGHTISNLMINRPNSEQVGLFGEPGGSVKIVNIGLLNVQIKGNLDVGGLVGYLTGTITNSYATGDVNKNDADSVGIIVGYLDGGTITNSYATGSVTGNDQLGGLVGYLDGGTITDSYATGSVTGRHQVGGLAGFDEGTITNSYATGSSSSGGLVGENDGTITNSYWDTDTSGILTSLGGLGRTTTQLQSPTTATGIYSNWGTANWDYGTASQYPALKYAQDCGASQQPACRTLLRGQRNNQPRIISPANNTKIVIADKDAGTIKTISVKVSDEDINDELTLLLSVIEGNSVTLGTADAKVPPNKDNAERKINKDLSISVPSNIMGGETELQLVAEDDSGLGNARSDPISLIVVVDVNEAPTVVPEKVTTRTVTIGQTLSLNTGEFFMDSNRDTLTYTATGLPDNNRFIFSTMTGVLKVTPQAADASMDKAGLSVTVTASDGKGGSASATFKLLISAEPSGDVEIKFNAIDDNTWQLTAISTVADANGIDETRYQWFKNGVLQRETSDTYLIPNNNSGRAGGTKYKVEVTYVDNIGQQTTKSDVYTVANQAPVIDIISPEAVKEGEQVRITANVYDANRDEWNYTWRVSSGISENFVTKTNNRIRFNFDVPADWIRDTITSDKKKTLQLEIEVRENRDGGETTTQTAEVVVTKINNGVSAAGLTIDRDENKLTLREGDGVRAIAADPDGKNNSPGESYRWQWCRTSCVSPLAWMDISDATTTTYTIPDRISGIEVEGTDRFRIKLSYTDGQGYRETIFNIQDTSEVAKFQRDAWSAFDGGAKAVCKNNDIDDDNDGLIELCYLEDIDAMRYDLKGTSYKYSEDATGEVTGCGSVDNNYKCFGYELVRDLDFNDDDSYISTTSKVEWTVNDYDDSTDNGWQPIGDYNALFEGNGHTISNLMINRPGTDNVGLFGSSQLFGEARYFNIGLVNVNINGNLSVGGLVGNSRTNTIMNSYVSGSVKGNSAIGGLVNGFRGSTIANSYASGSVTGNENVGGLTGFLRQTFSNRTTIANSYATGSVTGNENVGGLVGNNRANITNSYASGSVDDGDNSVGGLVGAVLDGVVTDSYWDKQTTMQENSAGGSGQNTAALTGPTTATEIYSNWDTKNWDFGTNEQYPIVKYARGGDNANPACRKLDDEEQSQQPVCGTVLPGQRNKPPRIIFPTTNTEILITEDEENTTKTISVRVADDDVKDKLTLLLSAADTKQNIVKLETIKATVLPNGKVVRDTNKELIIRTSEEIISGETMLQLIAEDNSGFGNSLASVSFKIKAIGNAAPTVMPIDNISLLEDTTATLVVVVIDADDDPVSVTVDSDNPTTATATIKPTGDANYTLEITGLSGGTATITVTANDGRGKSNSTATETFTVTVEANEAPTINIGELDQRLQVNDMVELTVSVSDENFDVNDKVTLRVESSAPSVVSVDQSEVTVTGDDTDKVFMLNAEAGGDATITISAKDSKEVASNSEMVQLHVNAPPTIESYDNQVTLKEGRVESINVTVSDVNTEDALTLRLTEAIPQEFVELVTTSVMVMTNNVATRDAQAFRIKGLKAGDTTLNIVAEDADTMAMASVDVTVGPNAMPELTIVSDLSDLEQLLEGTSKTLVVTATDDDDDPADLMVSVTSDNPAVVITPGAVDDSDYSFVITAREPGTAAITVTVDDGRDTPNSTATETFNVEVAANQAPVLEIVTEPSPTVELDATTDIVISIADANFDLGDSVTLKAMSSTPSVVSVTPEIVNGVGSNTSQTFTLTGMRVGESEISFTATDINDERSTVSVLLRVDSSLATGTVPTEPIIATVGEAFSTDTRTFFIYDGSDTLSYAATGLPDGLTISTRTGVISGTPLVADASMNKDGLSVTVTASDGRGGSAKATFTLLINAEPSGTVTISPKADNEWELITTSTVVDANGIDEAKTSYQWYKDNNTEVGTNRDTYPIPIDGRRGGTRYKVDVTFIDNIGQSVTTSSNVYEILNQAPVIDPISQKTVNEGGTISINPTVNDANNDDLTYTWRVSSGDSTPSILGDVPKTNKQLSFTMPTDWIKDASTGTDVTEILQLEIAATETRDGGETTTRTAEVIVRKFDNGASTAEPKIVRDESNERRLILETGDDTEAIAADPDGGVNPPAISYQWQWCQSSCSLMSPSWMDIGGQTEDTYSIPTSISGTRVEVEDRFRIKISYTDDQGYDNTIYTSWQAASASADFRVRTKVFLEGTLW